MPIKKDLSVSPYFDDFDETKNYYQVIFKPGVAVQTRELNQLHTILQNQIERFGNTVFKRGTIISGVNFIYYPDYPYIKIKDSQLDGITANPESYVGSFIVDPSSNLTAHVVNFKDGFESTDPDLKTLYLRYVNSGDDGNATAFTSASVLKVYDYLDSINKITINNGSSGFANADSVVFCSALSIELSTNTVFTVGETITQTGNNNYAIVTAVETFEEKNILKIRPRTADLSNTEVPSNTWVFTPGEDIIGGTSGATATIDESIGNTAAATLVTTADVGKISSISITNNGQGYYVAPYMTVKSSGIDSAIGSRNYNDLDIVSQNYLAQVTVASTSNAVGKGYAFGVTGGIIFQKGYFSSVSSQTVIVDKYSNSPDELAVGFDTIETIVDSNEDQSLLDNATGRSNEFAPGADRLKLEPTLVVLSSANAASNNEFLPIVEFSEGRAFRENKRTQFNTLMDEIALRTKEQAGDFVLNEFLVSTRSTANQETEGSKFSVVVDPGSGYINGNRIETISNYYITNDKGIDVKSTTDVSTTIDYGNYILVKETAGRFNCSTGDTIDLIDTAHSYVSNTTTVEAGTIPSAGDNVIATARVRNLVYDAGEVGTTAGVYRLYLFDINIAAGKKFSSIKGVRTQDDDSIADAVLTFDASLNTSVCKLFDKDVKSTLVMPIGDGSTKSVANISYVYRTAIENASMANTGNVSYLLADAEEFMGYASASLTDNEKKTVYIAPTSNNILLTYDAGDGTIDVDSSSNSATLSNTDVIDTYSIGDYVGIWTNSSVFDIRRVTGKTGSTLVFDSNVSATNSASEFVRAFPQNIPIPLARVPDATATLTNSDKALNIFLGRTIDSASATTCALGFDVSVQGTSSEAKAADRDNFVKLNLSSAGTIGPWCLGIPDIFRLKAVYLGTDTNVSTSDVDVTDQFYIDHNQNSDYYGHGYLYKRSSSTLSITSSNWLLVQFDAFTSNPGVYTISSYVSSNTSQLFVNDALPLANLGVNTHSFEVPEIHTPDGSYYDLTSCVDFRPSVANTAAYAKTAGAATTNPASTISFSGSDKKFPLPETSVTYDRDDFLGRKDAVVVSNDNRIKVVKGVPSTKPYLDPKIPKNTLHLNNLIIPPYPCIPENVSLETRNILATGLVNESLQQKRIVDKTITTEVNDYQIKLKQPRAYTMSDISKLERRISDLEYNVTLSSVESDLRDKTIPSAISPEINRFKYGFYVDDFKSDIHSDIQNVEFRARVVKSRAVPVSEPSLLTHGKGYKLSDYVSEYSIVTQDLASEEANNTSNTGGDTSNTGNTTPTVPSSNTELITVKQQVAYRTWKNSTYGATDVYKFKASQLSGDIEISANFFKNDNRIVVERGSTTLYDQTFNRTRTIDLTHTPSSGRDYTVTVYSNSPRWEYAISYPVDNITAVDPIPPTTSINGVEYVGYLQKIRPNRMSDAIIDENFGQVARLTRGYRLRVEVAGLKPNTKHTLKTTDAAINLGADVELTSSTTKKFWAGWKSGDISTTVVTDNKGQAKFWLSIGCSSHKHNHPWFNCGFFHWHHNRIFGNDHTEIPEYILVALTSDDNNSGLGFYLKNDLLNKGRVDTDFTDVEILDDNIPSRLVRRLDHDVWEYFRRDNND